MPVEVIEDNTELFKKEFADRIPQILESIGLHLEGEAKDELENSPRRVDTGNLRNSITHVVDTVENAVYIGTDVEYALYVHEGTGKFAAEGGGRQDPWWYQDENGKWHYTEGMAPNRFLKNAIERNESQIREYIENELKS